MRFPRGCASKIITVNAGEKPELTLHDIGLSMNIAEINMDLLTKITSSTCDFVCDTMVCDFVLYLGNLRFLFVLTID